MEKDKKIDTLLEKYFDGETSLSEERFLKRYFTQNDIKERHLPYVPMFNYFVEEGGVIRHKMKRQPLYYWAAAAACLVLLSVSGIKFISSSSNTQSFVYVNGEKNADEKVVGKYALMSISSVHDLDQKTVESQVSILDVFIGQ